MKFPGLQAFHYLTLKWLMSILIFQANMSGTVTFMIIPSGDFKPKLSGDEVVSIIYPMYSMLSTKGQQYELSC